MDLRSLTNTGFALRVMLNIAKMPPKVGYLVGRLIASLIAVQKKSPLVNAVRTNQWVARGEQLSPEELDLAVKSVFQHAARCYFDFYHNLHSPEALLALSPPTPDGDYLIQRSQEGKQGLLVVGPHLSGFDLMLLACAHRGLKGQGLSPGQPPGGYQLQNRYRQSPGLKITPVSMNTLQQAIQLMRNGGFAFTGVDRPVPEEKHDLMFFGRPSKLPTGPVRLAMKADVPIIIVAARMQQDGKYHLLTSDQIPMVTHQKRNTAIIQNAETVLKTLETFIEQAPDQWLMFHPVWPEALAEVP
jgi:KDO2-lipid IV(A) lauroyltransferase